MFDVEPAAGVFSDARMLHLLGRTEYFRARALIFPASVPCKIGPHVDSRAMSFRVPILRVAATIAVAVLTSPTLRAQESTAAEVKALRERVEQQAKQIETLTAQIARLTAKIDGDAAASSSVSSPPSPGTGSPELAIPAARVVAPPARPNVHIVVKGESLEKIAKAHGLTTPELQKANRITDPKKLQIGQQLVLPQPTPQK